MRDPNDALGGALLRAAAAEGVPIVGEKPGEAKQTGVLVDRGPGRPQTIALEVACLVISDEAADKVARRVLALMRAELDAAKAKADEA